MIFSYSWFFVSVDVPTDHVVVEPPFPRLSFCLQWWLFFRLFTSSRCNVTWTVIELSNRCARKYRSYDNDGINDSSTGCTRSQKFVHSVSYHFKSVFDDDNTTQKSDVCVYIKSCQLEHYNRYKYDRCDMQSLLNPQMLPSTNLSRFSWKFCSKICLAKTSPQSLLLEQSTNIC